MQNVWKAGAVVKGKVKATNVYNVHILVFHDSVIVSTHDINISLPTFYGGWNPSTRRVKRKKT